jgi:type III secretion protein J
MLRALTRCCVLAVICLLLSACRADLLTQVSETDANEALDALYATGIEGSKVPAGDKMFNVQVPESRMADALRVMQERGLPRPRHADLGALFKKEMVSSASEERIRFTFGVAQQLSGTLSQIPGVLYANVMPVMPTNDPLADKVKPASASVFIKHDPNTNIEMLRPAIKDLVARSIEGLAHDNITVALVVADPPQRIARVEPILPQWVVITLSLMAAVAVLGAGAAGFLLWRYKQLAQAQNVGEDFGGGMPALLNAANAPLSWLRSLWPGGGKSQPTATNEPRFDPPQVVPTKVDAQ